MTETYHYTECGLDSVYLVHGFELKDSRLRIRDIEGLHCATGAVAGVNKKKALKW